METDSGMRVSSKVFPADEGVAKQQSEGGLILSSKKLMCSSSDSLSVRASNEPLSQSWGRPLLGSFPGWKRLLTVSHLRHY